MIVNSYVQFLFCGLFEKLDLGCRHYFGIIPACALGTVREGSGKNLANMFCSGCILAKIQPVHGAGLLLTPMMGSIPGLVCMRDEPLCASYKPEQKFVGWHN